MKRVRSTTNNLLCIILFVSFTVSSTFAASPSEYEEPQTQNNNVINHYKEEHRALQPIIKPENRGFHQTKEMLSSDLQPFIGRGKWPKALLRITQTLKLK